jgi:lysophospholipase L1-like esterase
MALAGVHICFGLVGLVGAPQQQELPFGALVSETMAAPATSASQAPAQQKGKLILLSISAAAPIFYATATENVDTFDIYSPASNSVGAGSAMNANINGGSNTLVPSFNATSILNKVTLTAALGSNTLNFSFASGTGILMRYVAYNSAVKRFNLWNSGWIGATSSSFNQSFAGNHYLPLNAITDIAADLLIYMIGINDWNGGDVTAAFSTNVQAVITTQLATGGSIILMSPVPTNPGPTYVRQAGYVAALKTLALSNHVPFIDLWNLAGGTWNNLIPMFDAFHPTGVGYGTIAGYVQQALAPGFKSS